MIPKGTKVRILKDYIYSKVFKDDIGMVTEVYPLLHGGMYQVDVVISSYPKDVSHTIMVQECSIEAIE